MKFYSGLTALISLSLIASCKGPADIPDVNIDPEPDITISETVTVKSTSHFFPKETIIKATIAPKTGMRAFSSKILLLSESGKVFATDTAFPQLQLINAGPFSDITGFYLSDNSSGFLALDQDGTVSAFLDRSDSRFGSLEITGLGTDVELCESQLRAPGRMTLKSDGMVKRWETSSPEGAEALEFKALIGSDDTSDEASDEVCGRGQDFSLSITDPFPTMMAEKTPEDISAQLENSYNFKAGLYNGKMVLSHQGASKSVTIEEGLSIAGLKSPEWVFTTSQPLGNTFNQGLTLVRGDGENRIVMIANDYLAKAVFEGFNSP